MARARNIKPAFFANEYLADLPFAARLLFIGLWTLADREGRLEDRPKRIKGELFPYDDVDVDSLLQALADSEDGFITRYTAQDGRHYIQINNFTKHQTPHVKEAPSIIPPPPKDVPGEMRENEPETDTEPAEDEQEALPVPEEDEPEPAHVAEQDEAHTRENALCKDTWWLSRCWSSWPGCSAARCG